MSTRARIGIQVGNSIVSVYHHWDGYPQWLGRILNTHYTTKSQVIDLIDGGDMSTCWTKERWTGKELAPYVKEIKESEEYGPQYYAQRGEDCPPRLDESITEFINNGEEYGYIFKDGEWFCYDTKSWSDTFAQIIDIPEGALAV
tara:strand:+ start:194 stop:625 length:432 start_codon:yes stop_codon:yes gene_type:complete